MNSSKVYKSANFTNMGVRTFETKDLHELNIAFMRPYHNTALYGCLGIKNGVQLAYTNNNELMDQIANRIKERDLSEWIAVFKGAPVCESAATRSPSVVSRFNGQILKENEATEVKSKL